MKRMVEDYKAELTDENCKAKYLRCLEYIIDALEGVLYGAGVSIDGARDEFDPKKDKLLKTVITHDASLDRKIVEMITECYLMNEKVISPSKVVVYKYVAEETQISDDQNG